jgi:hypothetical protein
VRVKIPEHNGLRLHFLLIFLVSKIDISYSTTPCLLPLVEAREGSIKNHHLKRHEDTATELNSSSILHRRDGDLPGSDILQHYLLFHSLGEDVEAAVSEPVHPELLGIVDDTLHSYRDLHLVDYGIVEMLDLLKVRILPLWQFTHLIKSVLADSYSPHQLAVCERFLCLETVVPRGRGRQGVSNLDCDAIFEGGFEGGTNHKRRHLHVSLDG